MGRLVTSYTSVASSSGDALVHRDVIVFVAAFLAMVSLGAAVLVWLAARRHGWASRL